MKRGRGQTSGIAGTGHCGAARFRRSRDRSSRLPALVGTLPVVCHPTNHPKDGDFWFEMFSSELTEIVECANVDGGPEDPSLPLFQGQRSHLGSDFIDHIVNLKAVPGD
jgi:hypothetical protein